MGKDYLDDDTGAVVEPKRRWWIYAIGVFILLIIIIVFILQVPLMSKPMLPPWCVSDNDYHKTMRGVGDPASAGIMVEACLPGAGDEFEIITADLDGPAQNNAKGKDGPFLVHAVLTNFQVKKGKDLVTTFDPPMEIRISYTYGAWQSMEARGFDLPRIAYLEIKDGTQQEAWIEFDPEWIEYHEPERPGRPGYIIIVIPDLPDPLIGGC